MKYLQKITIILFVCLGTFTNYNAQTELLGLETMIEEGMISSFECQSSVALDILMTKIAETKNLNQTHWKEYWTAFGMYHQAIYYAYGEEEIEKAKEKTKSAIELLDALENKNSEDYALLAHLQSFSLQWVSGFSIIGESGKAEDWAQQALELDPTNPRAYFVSGSYDYHKPSFVGGGKKAGKLLHQALDLYKDWIPNPLLPSWGMDSSYAKLVQVYIRAEDQEKALQVVTEGLELYPDDRDLQKLKEKLGV